MKSGPWGTWEELIDDVFSMSAYTVERSLSFHYAHGCTLTHIVACAHMHVPTNGELIKHLKGEPLSNMQLQSKQTKYR